MLTRNTDQKIWCVYIHVYQIIKNWGHGPYNSCPTDNRRYFLGLSAWQNQTKVHMFYLVREVGIFGHVLAEKKVILKWLMNSNMVKPEKFGHLHLVYLFTIRLRHSQCSQYSDLVLTVFLSNIWCQNLIIYRCLQYLWHAYSVNKSLKGL